MTKDEFEILLDEYAEVRPDIDRKLFREAFEMSEMDDLADVIHQDIVKLKTVAELTTLLI